MTATAGTAGIREESTMKSFVSRLTVAVVACALLLAPRGAFADGAWTMNGKTWPDTDKVVVDRGDDVPVRFTNRTALDHPLHLHGHTFEVVEIDGKALVHPLAKDVSLVRAYGGTLSWRFRATSPPGRWLLHRHNDVHMMAGLMTEVRYRS